MVQGSVPQNNQETLQLAYQELVSAGLPPSILQTFLLRRADDRAVCRIVTIWKSMEALQEVRQAPEPPAAVGVFRQAGVEPSVEIFEVVHMASQHDL
jgi:heme-degrading monooxygenase HmoA